MTTLNKEYKYLMNSNRVEIKKIHRTKTQYEYFLYIFMGDSDYESILIYDSLHLTKSSAFKEAKRAIFNSPQPKIERTLYPSL